MAEISAMASSNALPTQFFRLAGLGGMSQSPETVIATPERARSSIDIDSTDHAPASIWTVYRRRTMIAIGWFLLVFGLLATVAPTPFGIVLVGIALTMLLTHSPWTKLRFRRYARRYPQTLAPLLRIPSIKQAIKLRKKRRRAKKAAEALARQVVKLQ